jgi:hypothetical protein
MKTLHLKFSQSNGSLSDFREKTNNQRTNNNSEDSGYSSHLTEIRADVVRTFPSRPRLRVAKGCPTGTKLERRDMLLLPRK